MSHRHQRTKSLAKKKIESFVALKICWDFLPAPRLDTDSSLQSALKYDKRRNHLLPAEEKKNLFY